MITAVDLLAGLGGRSTGAYLASNAVPPMAGAEIVRAPQKAA